MIKITRLPLLLLSLLFLQSCYSAYTETAASITSREDVLFSSEAQYGRILNSNDNMSWETPRIDFILTPTAVYLLPKNGSYSINIPYKIIDEVSVREVPLWIWWPLGEPTMLPDLLVIKSEQSVCWEGCVFRFDDPSLGPSAVALIDRQRALVDPFGRLDGPRDFGLLTSSRQPFLNWQPRPAYLQSRHPDIITNIDDLLRQLSPQLPDIFNQALVEAMNEALPSNSTMGWRFRPIDTMTPEQLVNYSSYRDQTIELLASEPDLDSLLFVRLTRVIPSERISAQYEPSVEMRITVDLSYRNLIPPSAGLVTQITIEPRYSVQHWLANDGELVTSEIKALARQTAMAIQSTLNDKKENQGPVGP